MTALDLWQSIVGIVGFISVLTVLYARFKAETRARAVEQKARETERENITRWRTNVERDIQDVIFQMAADAVPRELFADMLRRVDRLRLKPAAA